MTTRHSEYISELSVRSSYLYAWTTKCYVMTVKMNNYFMYNRNLGPVLFNNDVGQNFTYNPNIY